MLTQAPAHLALTLPAAFHIIAPVMYMSLIGDIHAIKGKKGARAEFDFTEAFEPLFLGGEKIVFPEPARVHVLVVNTGKSMASHFHLEVKVTQRCSRCLREFTAPLVLEFAEEYREIDSVEEFAAAPQLTQEGVEFFPFVEDHIDFGEAVRQNLILSIPMKAVCNPSCRGLCPVCGANLNDGDCGCDHLLPDPRLAPLREWVQRCGRSRN